MYIASRNSTHSLRQLTTFTWTSINLTHTISHNLSQSLYLTWKHGHRFPNARFRLPELLPRCRRQHIFSKTDIDHLRHKPSKPQHHLLAPRQRRNSLSTRWHRYRLNLFIILYCIKNEQTRTHPKSHNPITHFLSLRSLRAKLRLSTIIGLTLDQARLSKWQYDSHEAL